MPSRPSPSYRRQLRATNLVTFAMQRLGQLNDRLGASRTAEDGSGSTHHVQADPLSSPYGLLRPSTRHIEKYPFVLLYPHGIAAHSTECLPCANRLAISLAPELAHPHLYDCPYEGSVRHERPTSPQAPEPPRAPLSAPDDADEYTEEADWLPLDQLIRPREPSPPRDWPSRAPILIGFDAASVAQFYPTFDRVIVGRMGSDKPRGVRSEIGLRLDPHEWFFPRDTSKIRPATACPARAFGSATAGSPRPNCRPSRRSPRPATTTAVATRTHASMARWGRTTGVASCSYCRTRPTPRTTSRWTPKTTLAIPPSPARRHRSGPRRRRAARVPRAAPECRPGRGCPGRPRGAREASRRRSRCSPRAARS